MCETDLQTPFLLHLCSNPLSRLQQQHFSNSPEVTDPQLSPLSSLSPSQISPALPSPFLKFLSEGTSWKKKHPRAPLAPHSPYLKYFSEGTPWKNHARAPLALLSPFLKFLNEGTPWKTIPELPSLFPACIFNSLVKEFPGKKHPRALLALSSPFF